MECNTCEVLSVQQYLYSGNPEISIDISLGPNITVFQAETLAIKECAQLCLQRELRNRRISICSDSQAALMALSLDKIFSSLVRECRLLLQELATTNVVTLVWVPGHCEIYGNEMN